jgi:hypothetical protein
MDAFIDVPVQKTNEIKKDREEEKKEPLSDLVLSNAQRVRMRMRYVCLMCAWIDVSGGLPYAHYRPEDYVAVFRIWPLADMIIDPDVQPHMNLTSAYGFVSYEPEVQRGRRVAKKYGEFMRRTLTTAYPWATQMDWLGVGSGHAIDKAVKTDEVDVHELTYVRYASEEMGFGLFAAQPLTKGTPIGIYTGILTNRTVNTDYAWRYNRLANQRDNDWKLMNNLHIDGYFAGNHLRFVNHADMGITTKGE